jgi:hypothetical protein
MFEVGVCMRRASATPLELALEGNEPLLGHAALWGAFVGVGVGFGVTPPPPPPPPHALKDNAATPRIEIVRKAVGMPIDSHKEKTGR